MWPFGKLRCPVCGERFAKRNMRLSRRARGTGVCRHCFEGWARRGRKCGLCEALVIGSQAVAVFPDRRAIGHFDCGGVPVASH